MILDFIRSEKSPPSLVHLCFKFLYVICKVSFLIKNLLTALNKSRNGDCTLACLMQQIH